MPSATASQTIGPYWHLLEDPSWADLTRFGVPGEKITLTGAILDGDGKPCADACVEMWQSDPVASDTFPGFGRSNTDKAGMFRFTTVKPGPVAGRGNAQQAPHIALCILSRGLMRSQCRRASPSSCVSRCCRPHGRSGAAAASAVSAQAPGVQKLDGNGKPSDGKGFITPLIVHNGLIYIAGQGAHSRGDKSDAGKTPTIEMHTKMVMDGVKAVVEAGGGTMDSILQLTVYLAKLEYYDGMNSVFKTYFPNGGPARTTVAVAGLPGESLVEINCIAAVVRKGA